MNGKGRPSVTALVLAGSRGAEDPVASHAGVPHKALAMVAGIPMLSRVVAALDASSQVQRIFVCAAQPSLIEGLPNVAALAASGRLALMDSDRTPARSVLRALDQIQSPLPMLVTTADHALLTAEMIDFFCTAAAIDADVAVALARASVVRRAYPQTVRTYFRLSGDEYGGCNMFALRTERAEAVVAFWSQMEQHRKRPWRVVSAIGPISLLRYSMGWLSLQQALERLSKVSGGAVRAVEMPFAEAAIDVDKPSDLLLAEAILGRRA